MISGHECFYSSKSVAFFLGKPHRELDQRPISKNVGPRAQFHEIVTTKLI